MQTFKIKVAMDIRAYGYVEIDAEDIDKAIELATPEFIAENFTTHGYGSDDYDQSSPRDIWLGEYECEDTGEEGFIEKDLPNSHYPGGLAHDAAPDLLTALQLALPALDWCAKQWKNSPQRGEGIDVLSVVRAAIAKAEGRANG